MGYVAGVGCVGNGDYQTADVHGKILKLVEVSGTLYCEST